MSISPFSCICNNKKTHKLVFDGGVLGNYTVSLCHSCYLSQDKKFMISEEKFHEQ
ncbi:MAG: hypothetical protein IIA83_12170 [Thaumarchaeota archaeon]|nr:hypothetical protein [Nitrososphaerota archaeon]